MKIKTKSVLPDNTLYNLIYWKPNGFQSDIKVDYII